MGRSQRWLLCLLALCVLTASFTKPVWAEDDEYDEEEEDSTKTEAAEGESAVVTLTQSNFKDHIAKNKYALVMFMAPWCGHCKSMKPAYEEAAAALKGKFDGILGMVDATVEAELAKDHDVSGYPTLKWFIDGTATEYGGGRSKDEIVSWIKKKTGPPAETVDDVSVVADQIKKAEVSVTGYFDKFEGKEFDAFLDVARATDGVSFYQTTSKDVAKELGLKKQGVVLGRSVDDEFETATLDEKVTKEALEAFIKAEKLPFYLPFNQNNQPKIFGAGIPHQILLIGGEEAVGPKSDAVKILKDAYPSTKGKVVFVTVNKDDDNMKGVLDFFGLDAAADDIQVVGFFMEKNQKFKLKDKLSLKVLTKFADDLVGGKIDPDYKSEPIPEEPLDEGVTVVVGKNLDNIVLDPTKDVLLEVYAPWCGHCKQLVPIYKKLAKRFKKVDSVVIAKMDGTANEHKLIEVKGYPTILFFPAKKDAEPMNFDGERTLKGFTKFLKENAAIKFTLPKKGKEDKKEDVKEEETPEKDEL